jgi:hypothetical protein
MLTRNPEMGPGVAMIGSSASSFASRAVESPAPGPRLHRLFLELTPGRGPVKEPTSRYKTLLAAFCPKALRGKTRRRMAAGELADLERLDAKLKAMKSELKAGVQACGSHLMDINGSGAAGAAWIIQARTRCTSPVHHTDRRGPAAGLAARTAALSAA